MKRPLRLESKWLILKASGLILDPDLNAWIFPHFLVKKLWNINFVGTNIMNNIVVCHVQKLDLFPDLEVYEIFALKKHK